VDDHGPFAGEITLAGNSLRGAQIPGGLAVGIDSPRQIHLAPSHTPIFAKLDAKLPGLGHAGIVSAP
jgi:hypothetical protein